LIDLLSSARGDVDFALPFSEPSVILLEMYQSGGKGGLIAPDHPHDVTNLVDLNR
jgi:hypothetical protein